MANPFKPTFGVAPPLLVGRGELLELFEEALEEGPGAPARATIYTGARGTGKTVMLTAVEKLARNRGWLVISGCRCSAQCRRGDLGDDRAAPTGDGPAEPAGPPH